MDIEDILRSIEETFDTVDDERVRGLETVKTIQDTKNESLTRERKRLTRKYGENHPRVHKIDSRLTYNQGLTKDLCRNQDAYNGDEFAESIQEVVQNLHR